MTKTKAPSPTPLADAYGNPGTVVSGALIESAWGNGVVNRIVNRFPNKAALDTWAPAFGVLAITTDNNVVWMRDGATWKATSVGNVPRFRLTGNPPGQSVLPSALTTLTWVEAMDDSFVVSGGVLTVPPGFAGRWMFEWSVNFPAPSSGVRQVFCSGPGATRFGLMTITTTDPAPAVDMSGATTIVLAAGDTVSVVAFHTHTGGLLVNSSASNQYFQGHYMGPY